MTIPMHKPCKLFAAITVVANILLPTTLHADDTEIYLDQLSLPDFQTRPNVVFILDSSGSMGLPVVDDNGGRRREDNNYNAATTYPGRDNYNGGPGDDDFYYLYKLEKDWFNDPYVFINRVHKSQYPNACLPSAADTIPLEHSAGSLATFPPNHDTYIFNDGSADWAHMCRESDTSCAFNPGSGGQQIDCFSEQTTITDDNDYPDDDNNDNRLYAFNANVHNYLQDYYRFTILQEVMKGLIDNNYDINMAVMEFNTGSGSGGRVIKESVLATDTNNQNEINSIITEMVFTGVTPLAETLYEAYLYLTGQPAEFTGSINAAFSTGTTFDSPIDFACQKSHIILLTDGLPLNDSEVDDEIQGLTGSNCSSQNNADLPGESCLDELAAFIYTDTNEDNDIRDHRNLPDTQSITVHTIGFGLNNELLMQTAINGGGTNGAGSTPEALTRVFENALEQVEFEADTSVAPAVAVNSYSGLQNREDLFFALFRPNGTPRWTGNVKRYRLENGEIVDANGNSAIDSATGYFRDEALSYWTTEQAFGGTGDIRPDGSTIEDGGFAYELDQPTTRNFYTYTGTAPTYNNGAPSAIDLTNESLVRHDNNTDTLIFNSVITNNPALLGTGIDQVAAEEILTWALGNDDLNPNYFVADLIHNPPSVITYHTNPQDPDNVVFDDTVYAATNMGTFHAIDAETGAEIFTFIPQELLSNLTTYYQDIGGFSDKVYGLDAPMTVWRQDTNENGSIVLSNGSDVAESNDHVFIYQGMRRGGSNIYAFDVTQRRNPSLMWQINGTGLDTATGDYRDLAQTWSTQQRTKIRCGNNCERDVLIFGGGYDPVHDTVTSATTSSKGNAIYMVDALTSELIWSAGNGNHHDFNTAAMANSITADVTVIDINGDTYLDFLIAIDIYGKLWRIDFNDTFSTPGTFAAGGGIIADLGGDFRHFYNAPDVAFISRRGDTPFVTISVASGHRADPRETAIPDYLFVVLDNNAITDPVDYTYNGNSIITISDLGTVNPNDSDSEATDFGWKLALSNAGATRGEKGLSRTVTFNETILFTSFFPGETDACTGSTGSGNLYALDLLDGESTLQSPFEGLAHGGIPPEPSIIFGVECTENCDDSDPDNDITKGDITACVGTECITDDVLGLSLTLEKTYWREN